MFSAILTCRIKENGDSNLPGLLESIKKNSDNFGNFEVLIKFDTDDYNVPAMARTFPNYPFRINHIVDRRGRGANDMHLGYTTLLMIANPATEFFVTLSDDFEVLPKWDSILLSSLDTIGEEGTPFKGWVLETLKGVHDVFILQHSIHPNATMEKKFNMDWNWDDIGLITGLEIAPAFSKKLIQLCGGFGHMSFTDAWAMLLQHELYHRHSLNITRFTNQEYATRNLQGVGMDIVEQANRSGQATFNFRQMVKPWYKEMVQTQAQVVADYYHKHRKTILGTQFSTRTLGIDQTSKAERRGEIITHS